MNGFKKVTDDWYYNVLGSMRKADQGEAVRLLGFDGFDFGMLEYAIKHKKTKKKAARTEHYVTLTEGMTGFYIPVPEDATVKAKAQHAADFIRKKLKGYAEERLFFVKGTLEDAYKAVFEEHLREVVKQYGLSPRYEEVNSG